MATLEEENNLLRQAMAAAVQIIGIQQRAYQAVLTVVNERLAIVSDADRRQMVATVLECAQEVEKAAALAQPYYDLQVKKLFDAAPNPASRTMQ